MGFFKVAVYPAHHLFHLIWFPVLKEIYLYFHQSVNEILLKLSLVCVSTEDLVKMEILIHSVWVGRGRAKHFRQAPSVMWYCWSSNHIWSRISYSSVNNLRVSYHYLGVWGKISNQGQRKTLQRTSPEPTLWTLIANHTSFWTWLRL